MGKRFYSIQQQLRKKARYVRYIAAWLVIYALVSWLIICYSFSETVPYSKRKRVMLVSWDSEKRYGNREFEKTKAWYGNRVLPPDRPESIRVQRIAHNIVEALHRELKTHQLTLPTTSMMSDVNLKHLEGLEWEFIVVDDPIRNGAAYCGPAGKIVVSSEYLKTVESDAEIASTLGHEIAHAVARHWAERMSRFIVLRIMFLPLLIMPEGLLYNTYTLFSRLPFWRGLELEADYIGMLLMASAGYDPIVSPIGLKWNARINGKWSIWKSISCTHPHSEKRAQLLLRPKVMKEAMCLYRLAQLRQGISSAISNDEVIENCNIH